MNKKMLLSIHSQFKRNHSLSNDFRPLLYGHPDTFKARNEI